MGHLLPRVYPALNHANAKQMSTLGQVVDSAQHSVPARGKANQVMLNPKVHRMATANNDAQATRTTIHRQQKRNVPVEGKPDCEQH